MEAPGNGFLALQNGHFCHFSKLSHFSNIWCFFESFFYIKQVYWGPRLVFRLFLALRRSPKIGPFCLTIGFPKWPFLPLFEIFSILEYLVFFRVNFYVKQVYWGPRVVLRLFLALKCSHKIGPFCYRLCKMAVFATFQLFSFLEYLVFVRVIFQIKKSIEVLELFFVCFWHFDAHPKLDHFALL